MTASMLSRAHTNIGVRHACYAYYTTSLTHPLNIWHHQFFLTLKMTFSMAIAISIEPGCKQRIHISLHTITIDALFSCGNTCYKSNNNNKRLWFQSMSMVKAYKDTDWRRERDKRWRWDEMRSKPIAVARAWTNFNNRWQILHRNSIMNFTVCNLKHAPSNILYSLRFIE